MTAHARVLYLAFVGLSVACGGSESPSQVEFAVAVDQLPPAMRSELAPETEAGDTARLRLPGQVFVPPRPVRILPRDSADRTTPIGAVDADFSGFKTENDAWIVETFAAGERDEITRYLADSTIREGSRAMFRDIVREDLHVLVEFQTDSARYAVALLQYLPGTRRLVVNTYIWEDGEWRRTNTLVRNQTARFVALAYRSGSVRPVP